MTCNKTCDVTLANIGLEKNGLNYSPPRHSPKAIGSPFGHPDVRTIFPPAAWSRTPQKTAAE
jgi:hypothetical protein